MTYPEEPGFVKGSDTSRAAAESMVEISPTLRGLLYRQFLLLGERGATDDELEKFTGLKHQTVSARRRELVLDGFLRENGKRTSRSGRKAKVWVVVNPETKSVPPRRSQQEPPTFSKEEIATFRSASLPAIHAALKRRKGQEEVAVDYGPYGYLVAIHTKENWIIRWTDTLVQARY